MNTLTKTKFSLIEGSFNAADAKEVLLALFENKIRFHQQRIFSHEERFGKPCEDSVIRIAQLQESRSEILAMVNECIEEDKTLDIHSEIKIEIK